MKSPDRETVSELTRLPNIGKAMAADLRMIGIEHPQKLIGKDPFVLHEALCAITGQKHDPCVIMCLWRPSVSWKGAKRFPGGLSPRNGRNILLAGIDKQTVDMLHGRTLARQHHRGNIKSLFRASQ